MANINLKPFEVKDFSGGMTDNYIGGPQNKYQKAENFVIDEDRDLSTRDGLEVYDESNAQIPSGQHRISNLTYFEDQLFKQSQRNMYYIESSSFNTLQGPTSNPVFGAGDETNFTSYAEWNKHLIGANDAFSTPQRIYKDSSNNWQTNNLGLPSLQLLFAIDLANDLKTQFNAHIADASEHGAGADATNTVTSADAYEYESLENLVYELTQKYVAHEGDAELASGWSYHNAQEAADHSLDSLDSSTEVPPRPESLVQCVERLQDLKTKYNAHDADATAHTTGSTHQATKSHEPTVTAGSSTESYIYSFVLVHEYTIGEVTFKEQGPVYFLELEGVHTPDTTSIVFSDIPTLTNGTTENYDTSNIFIEIYRTKGSGTVSYYLNKISNGTSSYSDSESDDDIGTKRNIYTEGGVLDYDAPPKCKAVAQVNDVVWYLHVKEGTKVFPNRIRQGLPNNPGAAPTSLVLDVDDTVVGGAAVNKYLILLCENRIYRIEGTYDRLGRGVVRKPEISRTTGCISERSIVQTREGVFFAGLDGFYFTDGFRVVRISDDIPETYKTLVQNETQRSRIHGVYDGVNNRVLWACQSDTSSTDNDVIYVAHLRWGVSQNTPFTTWSGTYFNPTALAFEENTLVQASHQGYTFKYNNDKLTDPKVDTSITADNWGLATILYDFRSVAFDFGTTSVRKWVSKIVVTADNRSSLSLQIESNNDNSGVFKELKPMRNIGNLTWGDPTIVWGDTTIRWNYFPVLEQKRRFPARGLRCSYKQIKFTNAFSEIDSSTTNIVADVDSTAKTVTIDGGVDNIWLTNCLDYMIYFEEDSYTQGYKITDRTNKVLTYSDSSNLSGDATDSGWLIKGYKKGEVLNLLSYVIYFAFLTDTQSSYKGST